MHSTETCDLVNKYKLIKQRSTKKLFESFILISQLEYLFSIDMQMIKQPH
jgi:hypothetical protein